MSQNGFYFLALFLTFSLIFGPPRPPKTYQNVVRVSKISKSLLFLQRSIWEHFWVISRYFWRSKSDKNSRKKTLKIRVSKNMFFIDFGSILGPPNETQIVKKSTSPRTLDPKRREKAPGGLRKGPGRPKELPGRFLGTTWVPSWDDLGTFSGRFFSMKFRTHWG